MAGTTEAGVCPFRSPRACPAARPRLAWTRSILEEQRMATQAKGKARRTAAANGGAPAKDVGHATPLKAGGGRKMPLEEFELELERLQLELVKMQDWVKANGLKV